MKPLVIFFVALAACWAGGNLLMALLVHVATGGHIH